MNRLDENRQKKSGRKTMAIGVILCVAVFISGFAITERRLIAMAGRDPVRDSVSVRVYEHIKNGAYAVYHTVSLFIEDMLDKR